MGTSPSLSHTRTLSHFPSIFIKREKALQVPSSLHLLLPWQIRLHSSVSPSLSLPLKSVITHNLTLPLTSNHGVRRNYWGRAIHQPPHFGLRTNSESGRGFRIADPWGVERNRCSFMNFAKNLKRGECEESQPKKFLTGEEWKCPQCDFFNFGRNALCLRCDCKKSVSGVGAQNPSVEGHLVEKEQQQWFTKITELEKSSDVSNSVQDGFFPRTTQPRDNSSAVATENLGVDVNSDGVNHQITGVDIEINEFLDGVLDQRSSTTGLGNNKHPSQVGLTRDNYSGSQMGNKETDQAEKSETWFKKVAELHNVEDLSSAISNENFQEIMPMHKGENRFVASKNKDRSLSSPINKRRAAMEQDAGNNKYVPFVPFPPDYFAKDKPQEGSDSRVSLPNDSNTTSIVNQQSGALSSNLGIEDKATRSSPRTSVTNFEGDSSDSSENQSIWQGRSLEGSAVKETDPLDMSEEAKAERWFQRVAQIKDISELSQIPDEDFPSIMPMRKGVNRFVVSKRKTPLERRLTSSQYRRNIPAVNLDPVKKESDSN